MEEQEGREGRKRGERGESVVKRMRLRRNGVGRREETRPGGDGNTR